MAILLLFAEWGSKNTSILQDYNFWLHFLHLLVALQIHTSQLASDT